MQVHYATAECNPVVLVSVACLIKPKPVLTLNPKGPKRCAERHSLQFLRSYLAYKAVLNVLLLKSIGKCFGNNMTLIKKFKHICLSR